MADDTIRILMQRATARRISRRGLLGAGAGGLAALALAACGGDGGGASGGPQVTAPEVTKAPAKLESELSIYSWADYQNPENTKAFESANNLKVKIDQYDSNEAAIAKLELAGASSGYDIVVPTGAFIPQMAAKGIIAELDKSKIPNFANLDPKLLNQPWDQGNKYSIVKDWGTTGVVYDKQAVTTPISTWNDFLTAAKQDGVSGKVSVLATPGDVTGIWFWANGIDWNTTDPAQLKACEDALKRDLVPHLRKFDSFPRDPMVNGDLVLAQAFNGDARQTIKEDPERFAWALPGPKTEIWIDNWCILADAPHPEAAHAWLNNILDPKVSAAEIDYHGYNTGVPATREHLPADLDYRELIYFTDAQIATMVAGSVANEEQVTKIFNALQAAAGK
jgi:spermidine/putrescine transport system substrate-binding protein